MGQRKQYSKEFKKEAVRLAAGSKNKSGLARELGIELNFFLEKRTVSFPLPGKATSWVR